MRFLLFDRVTHLEPGKRNAGVKTVPLADDALNHHFERRPVYPGTLVIDGMVGSIDGETILRDQLSGPADDPVALGDRMVESLLGLGAAEVLAEIRDAADAAGGRVDGLLET